jgi:hypothetical protein
LRLTTLETRRIRGDLLEVYKIAKKFDDIEFNTYFMRSTTELRGHSCKLFKPGFHLDCRKYSFSKRVINIWNSLEENIIESRTVDSFKVNIDKFLKERGFK